MTKAIETPFELRSWHRQMCFTPTEIAILNVKSHQAVQSAIAIFEESLADMNLSAEQLKEAREIFSERMSVGLEELVDTVQQACARRTDF